jgi:diaminopropionate ammonia-lyase
MNPIIIVVEPEAAPALIESIQARRSVVTQGPSSNMGRLDCKEASLIALVGLAEYASYFITLSEMEVEHPLAGYIAAHGFQTSPSWGADLAALFALSEIQMVALSINKDSRILTIMSEADPAWMDLKVYWGHNPLVAPMIPHAAIFNNLWDRACGCACEHLGKL